MTKAHKVAGVTVLYNPDAAVIENIQSYACQIDRLFVIDNSDCINTEIVHDIISMDNVCYINNNGNQGIARALNVGAMMAIEKNYDFLLTMDQDSKATPRMVDTLLTCFNQQDAFNIGIVSPFHLTAVDNVPPKEESWQEVLTAWTSGNILNLAAYKKVGPFKDELFIDFVDHEYCLRLQSNGFRVFRANGAILYHDIGTNQQENRFLHLVLITSNHSALRRYYITRNRFWVTRCYRQFTEFCWIDRRRFCAEIINILFFENAKIQKYLMTLRGYLDYRRGRMGKFIP
jgi:rhamnosyltransferase